MRGDVFDRVDSLAYRAMLLLRPEFAHTVGKFAMRLRLLAPGPVVLPAERAPVLFGQQLGNPLGLAAGFDKNGEIVDAALEYGFGFVEVGSVTFKGGKGNPRPRLFRLDDKTLLNRMGLNGQPAERVAARLKRVKTPCFGVNIAKTHSPDILGDAAIDDIGASYRLLLSLGMYSVINISCPNTREGRTFEDPAPLGELLAALNHIRQEKSAKPLLVKLSPVLDPKVDPQRLDRVLETCEMAGIDGYVCCNTLPAERPGVGRGGISGREVRPIAYRVAEFIAQRLPRRTRIGCGGIFDRGDLTGYLDRGCVAAQAYTGFVRGPLAGTRFAHRVLDEHGSDADT